MPCVSRFTVQTASLQEAKQGGPAPTAARPFLKKEHYPFVGLPDPDHTVADRYGQEVKLLKMGRMPAMMVIDKLGQVVQSHYADNMRDYPANSDVLTLLDEANAAVTS
ncbi:MAG TPA: redoxin family protein [Anaerolineae bacterium]|nr:redoxin family protein [Anaerolineae bacterium]